MPLGTALIRYQRPRLGGQIDDRGSERAQAGKLKNLSIYQTKPKATPTGQTAGEMLEAMRLFKEMGVPLSIRQAN